MPEELRVDCFECKDLEFARNLAAQMKEGYGRHNSNLTFRQPRPLLDSHGRPFMVPIFFRRENQQARVIGRVGYNAIRERWQDCEIGDAVSESKFDHGRVLGTLVSCRFIDKVLPKSRPLLGSDDFHGPFERLSFERVRTRLTQDNGVTWNDEVFWKRIS